MKDSFGRLAKSPLKIPLGGKAVVRFCAAQDARQRCLAHSVA
jgi:hypothetical protein